MARKSSMLSFRKLIECFHDNSMGDYNSIVFKFIDDSKLQYKFEEYLQNYRNELEEIVRRSR